MNTKDIAGLRRLWQAVFGDTDGFLDSFFRWAFSPERCHDLEEDGVPVSALYWLPCTLNGRSLAYVYAVATAETHRGRGLCRQLMTETHEILKQQGYAGAILVPATPELFDLYGKLGYRTCCTCREFTCQAAETGAKLQQLDAQAYARRRAAFLPEGGVVQEGAALDFLQEQARFYGSDICVLTAVLDGDMLVCKEFLGDISAAGSIVKALGCSRGSFRTPGPGRDFAMFLPFTEDCPKPGWFGLALD